MPFAGHGGEITGVAEHFGDGDAIVIEATAIARDVVVIRHVADAGLVRIKAGEQGRATGAAAAGVVELREAQAGAGELVEVGSGNLAAVATDIGKAEVIGENDDDVGF